MQQLLAASKSARKRQLDRAAVELMEAVPPITWFIRKQMRKNRGSLSMPQLRALCKVYHQPGASVSGVAEHLGESLPTASRLVNGLVTRGLLRRVEHEVDRRQLSLQITPRGRVLFERVLEHSQLAIQDEISRLSEPQRQAVVAATSILRSVFGSFSQPRGNN